MKLILIFLVSCTFLKTWAHFGAGLYVPPEEKCTSASTQCGQPRNKGTCRLGSCSFGESPSSHSNCNGRLCLCCIPNQIGAGGYVPPEEKCTAPSAQCGQPRNRGMCRLGSCLKGENPSSYSICNGGNCLCCITNRSVLPGSGVRPGTGVRPGARCTYPSRICGKRDNGFCRITCFAGERICPHTNCDGPNCKCCKPEGDIALLQCLEQNQLIRGNLSTITEENREIKEENREMEEELTLTKTKLEESNGRNKHIREVDINHGNGESSNQTSFWGDEHKAWNAFQGSAEYWVSGETSQMPQAIWIHFGTRPLKVLSYTFKSHVSPTLARQRGPSKYEFFGSNSTSCRDEESHVVLNKDYSGKPFSQEYDYRSGIVEKPDYYSCYGFKILEVPGNKYTTMRNIRLFNQ